MSFQNCRPRRPSRRCVRRVRRQGTDGPSRVHGRRSQGEWYSKEICGGPHVEHTAMLGHFRIVKEESSTLASAHRPSWSEHP